MRPTVVVLVVIAVLSWFGLKKTAGQANPNCSEFGFRIDILCCCSAGCCSEAKPGEFSHYGNDLYKSNVTGQIVQRTGWSQDDRTIKCACTQEGGTWRKRDDSFVRCLFPPAPST